VRTNNNTESHADKAKIPDLYERYFDEELDDVIPEIDQTPTQSQRRYAVYADYDSDENGDYTILVGKQVSDDAETPDQFEGTTIDQGNYLKFVGQGQPPEVVSATWEHIWEYFRATDTHDRAFTTDFEVYDQSKPDQVEIYIAVQ
ncbi:MAG: effector binding domain-containing protein, partial [Pirellulaceae bacterium]